MFLHAPCNLARKIAEIFGASLEVQLELTLPTAILRTARENAGMNQAALAGRLGVSGSVLSRLEKEDTTDRAMAWRYLEGVGSEESAAIREFFTLNWRITERPAFHHPDRATLWDVERALQLLDDFEHSPDFDPILARPVHTLRSRLMAGVRYLQRIDHGIAWIGSIGVGKTTALAYATNLVVHQVDGHPKSVFPVGRGRTTVCEVSVKLAPAFGIVVESLSNDEIRALVSDLVNGITSEAGVSTEHDRVLRNMADLRKRQSVEDGKRIFIDPIKEFLSAGDTVEDVVTQIMVRLNLANRTQNQMILSDKKEHGLEWLAENVEKINFGQHPDFSVPARITVLLPSKLLRGSSYDISVIDTKGIEGTTQRPDLQSQIDDPRNLSVLCTRFEEAPGSVPLTILRDLGDIGADAIERGRVCLLVLPRGDEAIGVRGDGGETSESREDGYFIREDQIQRALAAHNLPEVPIIFYDAMRDSPQSVWLAVNDQVAAIRRGYEARARRLLAASASLMENADAARSQEARMQISTAIDRITAAYGDLPIASRAAHQNLIEQMRDGHSSSIAASMNRRGTWTNFSVHHMLGVGVRADANARTSDLIVRIDAQLVDLAQQFDQLVDIRQLIAALRDDLNDRRQEFLAHALAVGSEAFKSYLDDADDLWRRCTGRWGQGSGYRSDVADIVRRWFEEAVELHDARKSIDKSLQQAWREFVLKPLILASRVDADDENQLDAA
jgi:transcriptional regulator with XRE-family HTH domain